MKRVALILALIMLTGCASPSGEVTLTTAAPPAVETIPEPALPPDPVRKMLDGMSLEQRVGQLFLTRCDDTVALEHIAKYHLGGFVLFGRDFEGQTPESFREKIAAYQAAAGLPLLLAVDEEGGTVTRISSNPAFSDRRFPAPRSAYDRGGMEEALSVEEEKCRLLQSLGLNVNLGPVCDIATDPSAFLYQRSLGQNADITSQYISGTVTLMNAYRIGSCLKHFPGYGNNADTHTGIAVDHRALGELEGTDLIPFAAGMDSGCGAIMVSHTIVECLDAALPASLSPAVHRYLRESMGFDRVIMTDDLAMQAITNLYGVGEAAVMAVLAGNDLLCSTDYVTQYEAVLAAVLDGRIDIDTLNNAAGNVLRWKMELGIL